MSELLERLMARSDRSGECWLWIGYVDPYGYANIKVDGHYKKAHRVAYELLVGPIPDGHQIDHLCRVRKCINPAHLEPVTARENTMRSPIALAAVNAAKTHCPQGHPYDEANTIVRSCGRRRCRACNTSENRQKRSALKGGEPR